MLDLQHLSYSSISAYQLCPRSWAYKYVNKIQTPSSPNLVLGSAVHGTVEAMIRARCKQQTINVPALYQEAWGKATQQEVDWQGELPEATCNEGLRLVTNKDVQATVNGLAVMVENDEPVIERKLKLRVPGVPIPIIGYMDFLGADGVPYDLKTAARSWTMEKANKEIQPLFYLAAMNQLGDTMNVSYYFRYVVFVKTKTPQVQLLQVRHTARDLFWLLGMIQDVWRGMCSGIYPCADASSWKCSPKWCSYWHICKGK